VRARIAGRGKTGVGLVNVGKDFRDGSKCLDGNFAVDVNGTQQLRKIRVLTDPDAVGKGDFHDLLGNAAASTGDHAGRAAVVQVVRERDSHGLFVVFVFTVFFGCRQAASFAPICQGAVCKHWDHYNRDAPALKIT